MTFRMFLESKKGSYAGMHPLKESINLIEKFIDSNNIKNPVRSSSLHVTLIYSRKYLPNYKAAGYLKEPIVAEVNGFDVWKYQDGNKCLVMKLDSKQLVDRHKQLMKEHNATFDYDEYTPHITLSYNIGDFNFDNLKDIPKVIKLNHEYGDEIDLEWVKNV